MAPNVGHEQPKRRTAGCRVKTGCPVQFQRIVGERIGHGPPLFPFKAAFHTQGHRHLHKFRFQKWEKFLRSLQTISKGLQYRL